MKCLLVIVAALAVAQANHISTQYHSQDGHHGYNYGYSGPDGEKEETASHNRVQGGYKFGDKHGVFTSEVKYDLPQKHHHHEHHGQGHHHHDTKPFSYSSVSHHPVQHHHHHEGHHNFHHLHKRSLFHHHQPAVHQENHHEYHHEQPKWHGPIHVPVIVHGVPTETPEVRQAKAHLNYAHAQAHSHSAAHAYSGHDNHYDNHYNNHYDNSEHTSHHGSYYGAASGHEESHHNRWTGPIHVPVIEHGVPTETPEVRHAKAHLFRKHHEAQSHPEYNNYSHDEQHYGHGYVNNVHSYHHDGQYENHNSYHGDHHTKWTGPIHVPVLHHGVPTETPEVRHAKAQLFRKHQEAQSHEAAWHKQQHHY